MQSNNLHNDFTELISKYLSGNANDAEVRQLENWVSASPGNRQQFMALKKAWHLTSVSEELSESQIQSAWEEVSNKSGTEGKTVKLKPRNNRRIFLRFAAALMFLLAAGFWIFVSDGEEQPLVAAAADVSEELELPDGSKIILNRNSSINYSPEIDENQRTVRLDGDAFFDVIKDKSRPFVITAGEVEIEVLGTSFYVDSRNNVKEVQVSVAEGSVAVRTGGQEQILKEGEAAIYKKSEKNLSKKSIENENYHFLKTGTLNFEDSDLESVVFDLNRFYNSNISIEPGAFVNCRLTSKFKNKSLPAVVRIIEKTLGIQSESTDNGIIFYGECE